MFYVGNKKFTEDARKAFFGELSMRLELMSEDIDIETPDSHFDEMIEIINELKVQALNVRVDKICAEAKAKDDMQKWKDLPISVKIETPEVKF